MKTCRACQKEKEPCLYTPAQYRQNRPLCRMCQSEANKSRHIYAYAPADDPLKREGAFRRDRR